MPHPEKGVCWRGDFMMNASEKIAALRSAMASKGVAGYLIPSADPHMSEYLPLHYGARAWFSGFTGSAGTLAVTTEKAALWTDGRYFIQAERELAGSGIELMRMNEPGVPKVEEWLAQQLPAESVMGLDGNVNAVDSVEKMEKAFAEKRISICDTDLVKEIWTQDRPALPATAVWALGVEFAGKSAADKLADVRAALEKHKANATLVTRLDSVAWLLNLRASDIAYNPFAMAYCLVLPQKAVLFIDTSRVPQEIIADLAQQGVEVREYHEIDAVLGQIAESVTMVYEKTGLSYHLYCTMKQNSAITLQDGEELVALLKGVKNETEIKNLKNAHVKDGVAMVRFAIWLETQLAENKRVTECDVDAWLRAARAVQPDNLGESFNTIAAYGGNAAMMHYAPEPETCAVIEKHGFLLVDSGAQYRDGTTDITRTYSTGELTEEEKRYYTLVLKSHIDIARAVFKDGMAGMHLDILARETMWREGLDYRCGTGHGVGFVGGVHEGPQSLSARGTTPFVPGMTITDEPGVYEEGKLGIRIENELLCKEYKETEYGKFYCFEPITYCPIDTKPVLAEMLTQDEKNWLNAYHTMVLKTLSPYLNEQEKAWLEKACQAV